MNLIFVVIKGKLSKDILLLIIIDYFKLYDKTGMRETLFLSDLLHVPVRFRVSISYAERVANADNLL